MNAVALLSLIKLISEDKSDQLTEKEAVQLVTDYYQEQLRGKEETKKEVSEVIKEIPAETKDSATVIVETKEPEAVVEMVDKKGEETKTMETKIDDLETKMETEKKIAEADNKTEKMEDAIETAAELSVDEFKYTPEFISEVQNRLISADLTIESDDFLKMTELKDLKKLDEAIKSFSTKYPLFLKSGNTRPLNEGLNPAPVSAIKPMSQMSPEELYAYAKRSKGRG